MPAQRQRTQRPDRVHPVFDRVSRTGTWPASAWTGDYVGAGGPGAAQGIGGYHQVAGRFTVPGSGDIAPLIAGPLNDGPNITIRDYLIGTFAGLIAVAVVATMFMTAEYRRGLIRTTLAASPNRGRGARGEGDRDRLGRLCGRSRRRRGRGDHR